jgi:hypothetical protein
LDLFPEKELRGLAGAVDKLNRIFQLGLVHVAQYADQRRDAYTPGYQRQRAMPIRFEMEASESSPQLDLIPNFGPIVKIGRSAAVG